jgi:hypothetical protein
VDSAAAVRSAVPANPGKTVCVRGSIGNLNLGSVRPSATVRIAPDPAGGSLGAVDLTKAANIDIEGIRLRSATVAGDASKPAQNISFRSCWAGGTSDSSRLVVFAVIDIRAYSSDVLVSGCEIAWTGQGGGDNGYGVRAVNGQAGPITNVTVERSRLHHLSSDGIQLSGVENFTLDRSEIAYCATAPGGPDTHADSIQIMDQEGTNRYTNNWIHHTGYYTDTQVPSSAGQWIMHDYATGSMLVENNLITDNRNYAPAFSGVPANVTLRHNTIVRNGTAFGAGADDMQWSAGSGSGKSMVGNIVGALGGGSGVAFSGNVFIDQGGHGASDLGHYGVAFDTSMNPTNLPASHADAGYRKPAGAPW